MVLNQNDSNSLPRFQVRPVKMDDLDAIHVISTKVGPGFISLPDNLKIIESKIDLSMKSFAAKNDIKERLFFFVLEDLENHEIVATSAIEARADGHMPYYNFTILDVIQWGHIKGEEKQLPHSALIFGNEYQNASLFGALFVDSKLRGHSLGSFMSRMRGLFVAEFSEIFSDLIISSIRGHFNSNNNSEFWDAIGAHFFGMDFSVADKLHACDGTKFVADLAPKYPIYLDLLSIDAQRNIGRPHVETEPALHVLEKEGFIYRGVIDIFDGGPIIEANKNNIKTVRESKKTTVAQIEKQIVSEQLMMICNARIDFRAALGKLNFLPDGRCVVSERVAEMLEVSVDDSIRYAVFR